MVREDMRRRCANCTALLAGGAFQNVGDGSIVERSLLFAISPSIPVSHVATGRALTLIISQRFAKFLTRFVSRFPRLLVEAEKGSGTPSEA
jgi:hypothetical protein